jgi:hypothetical protein
MRDFVNDNRIISALVGWALLSAVWCVYADYSDRNGFAQSIQYGDFSPRWKARDVHVAQNGLFWSASIPQFSPGSEEYRGHQIKTFFMPPDRAEHFKYLCKEHDLTLWPMKNKFPYEQILSSLIPALLAAALAWHKKALTRRGGITRLGCGKEHAAKQDSVVFEAPVLVLPASTKSMSEPQVIRFTVRDQPQPVGYKTEQQATTRAPERKTLR